MRYLLDVNALIALGHTEHSFHLRVVRWLQSEMKPEVLTCSITELGFVRVLAQNSAYGMSVVQARDLLVAVKEKHALPFGFLADGHDVRFLPGWVKTSAQTTDGHLLELARAHGAEFATLDRRIPGAFVIP